LRTVLLKRTFLVCLLIIGLSSPSYANDIQISLFAGDNLVDAALGGRTPLAMADMIYGGGFTYRKDGDMKYSLGEAYLGVGNNFTPGWQFDAGFKGVYGQAEDGLINDATVGGVGFFLNSNFSFVDWLVPLPISLRASATYIPEVLAFTDLKKLMVAKGGIGFHIFDVAIIEAGYRYTQMDLEDAPEDWTLDDDAVYFGLGLEF
jgi:hypothetical protein